MRAARCPLRTCALYVARMTKSRAVAALAAMSLTALMVTGCSSMMESYNDAPISHKYDNPAEVYSMPDGFANVSSKCDRHGNRMYTTRTDGGEAMAVVPADPSCAR